MGKQSGSGGLEGLLIVNGGARHAYMTRQSSSVSQQSPYKEKSRRTRNSSPVQPRYSILEKRPRLEPSRDIPAKKTEQLDQKMQIEIERTKLKRKISYSHRSDSEPLAKIVVNIMRNLTEDIKLEKFKLRNCGVTKKTLNILLKGIKPREVKTLDLSGNRGLDLGAVEMLKDLLQSKFLDLSNTELDENQISNLGNITKVRGLKLKHTAFNHDSIAEALAKLINNGLTELSLVDSKITDQQLENVAKALNKKVFLRALNLSHVTLGEKGVKAVAHILNKTNGMEKMILSSCGLNTHLLKTFQETSRNKITLLDVSSNHGIANHGTAKCDVTVLAKLADKVDSEELDISSNRLTDEHVEQLLKDTAPPQKIRTLCMSENPIVTARAAGRLVAKWKLKNFDFSECRLTASDIRELGNSLEKHKLGRLDVSDPDGRISGEKREALQTLSATAHQLLFGTHEIWE